jgi:ABC-type uncharacterized transport system permease subunit
MAFSHLAGYSVMSMKLNPAIAGIVVTLLAACLLSVAWRYFAPANSSSVPGVAIWFISISLGIWEYRRLNRGHSSN